MKLKEVLSPKGPMCYVNWDIRPHSLDIQPVVVCLLGLFDSTQAYT